MNLVAVASDTNHHLKLRIKRPGERRSVSRSATRALDVLELFADAQRPLRAVEIARMLGLTPSSANQLLKTMLDSAHLVFDARAKTYHPSPRLAAIGEQIGQRFGIQRVLSGLVQDVRLRTGLIAGVSTPNDLFMQIIDIAGPGTGHTRGLQISVFGSAIGSAFLSTLSEAEVRRLAERARVPDGDVNGVLDDLAKIRTSGYAAGSSTSPEICSIAIPLPDAVLSGQAVLGIAGPTSLLRRDLEGYHAMLRNAVADWMAGSTLSS